MASFGRFSKLEERYVTGMSNKNSGNHIKRYLCMSIIVLLLAAVMVLGLRYSSARLTYLEYSSVSDSTDSNIPFENNGDVFLQHFVMPYDILDSVSIRIGTYDRDNNSDYLFSLYDSNGLLLYSDTFNASHITDNEYYRIEFDKRLRLIKGNEYSFSITSNNVTSLSNIALYISEESGPAGASLYHNGELQNGYLNCRIYGGDADSWWIGSFLLLYTCILIAVIWLYWNGKKRRLHEAKWLQGLILGICVFFLLCTFSSTGRMFIDESDNFRGGMVIANGGVLYKDYITQHTPLLYYLCSFFAWMGAGSVEQFRLSYYVFESIIWALVYIRHRDYYGEKKMVILPIVKTVFLSSILIPYGYMVISDGVQGLLFAVLMLEMIRYFDEKTLSVSRCIVMSLCIWGSIGVAFVSVYALFFLFLIFVAAEVQYLRSESSLSVAGKRYFKLFLAMIIPPVLIVAYFYFKDSLHDMYEQAYLFNREIYPQYMEGGYGDKIYFPFISAVRNFFLRFSDAVNKINTSQATVVDVMWIVALVLSIAAIIKLCFEKKKYKAGLALVLMMIFSATRDYGFHGLPAWYLSILIIVLYIDIVTEKIKRFYLPVVGIVLIVLSSTFIIEVCNNLVREQSSITELESKVIELTDSDSERNIYLDALMHDSLYLEYRGRYPVNNAVYMLPWYMDWYEKNDVEAIIESQPHIVVYDEDRSVFDLVHYNNTFDSVLSDEYTRLGEEDWERCVWIRNDYLGR